MRFGAMFVAAVVLAGGEAMAQAPAAKSATPASASAQVPWSSGPRWTIVAIIRSAWAIRVRASVASEVRKPAKPHMVWQGTGGAVGRP